MKQDNTLQVGFAKFPSAAPYLQFVLLTHTLGMTPDKYFPFAHKVHDVLSSNKITILIKITL